MASSFGGRSFTVPETGSAAHSDLTAAASSSYAVDASTASSPPDGVTSSSGGTTFSSATSSSAIGSERLSAFQRRLLQQNWTHLTKSGSGGVSNVMFQKLLARKPELRQTFTKASVISGFSGEGSANVLPEHVRALTELLDRAIQNLSAMDERGVGEICTEFGRHHAHLNSPAFNSETWDVFGQIMLESVTQLEVVRKHKELVRAWMILISYLIDKLRDGHITGVRRLNFQRQKALTLSPNHGRTNSNSSQHGGGGGNFNGGSGSVGGTPPSTLASSRDSGDDVTATVPSPLAPAAGDNGSFL